MLKSYYLEVKTKMEDNLSDEEIEVALERLHSYDFAVFATNETYAAMIAKRAFQSAVFPRTVDNEMYVEILSEAVAS